MTSHQSERFRGTTFTRSPPAPPPNATPSKILAQSARDIDGRNAITVKNGNKMRMRRNNRLVLITSLRVTSPLN